MIFGLLAALSSLLVFLILTATTGEWASFSEISCVTGDRLGDCTIGGGSAASSPSPASWYSLLSSFRVISGCLDGEELLSPEE